MCNAYCTVVQVYFALYCAAGYRVLHCRLTVHCTALQVYCELLLCTVSYSRRTVNLYYALYCTAGVLCTVLYCRCTVYCTVLQVYCDLRSGTVRIEHDQPGEQVVTHCR